MLKTASNVLKTAGDCTSFGLNGFHNYRNSNADKAARLWPPPGTSKPSAAKGLQPIMTDKNRQNDVKSFAISNLGKDDFRKNPLTIILQSITSATRRRIACQIQVDLRP